MSHLAAQPKKRETSHHTSQLCLVQSPPRRHKIHAHEPPMPSPSRNPDRRPLTRTSHQHLSTSRTLPCTIPTIRHQIQNNLRPPSPSVSSHLLPATEICNSPPPSSVLRAQDSIGDHPPVPAARLPAVRPVINHLSTTHDALAAAQEQRAVNRGGWGGIAPRMKRVLAIPIPPPLLHHLRIATRFFCFWSCVFLPW